MNIRPRYSPKIGEIEFHPSLRDRPCIAIQTRLPNQGRRDIRGIIAFVAILATTFGLVAIGTSYEPAKPRGGALNTQSLETAAGRPQKRSFDQSEISKLLDKQDATLRTEQHPITVGMAVAIKTADPLVIVGSTNLPEGAQVAVWLLWGDDERKPPPCVPRCAFQGYVNVKNGHFEIGSEIINGEKLIPHTWKLLLLVIPNAAGQPTSVTSMLGRRGQFLRGPYVRRHVNQNSMQVTFPWKPDPTSDEYVAGLTIEYIQNLQITPTGEAFLIPARSTASSAVR